MARRPRLDAPDTWHHVMNRGIARRTVFETEEDRRFFMALLAREVHEGRIEIHAICLLITHFHALVRSRTGELAKVMHRVLFRYSRYFNRKRKRDGALWRNRYCSRLVDSDHYRRALVSYIHDNPVAAGMVSDPAEFRWSSAYYLAGETRPAWLETSWIDHAIETRGRTGSQKERLAQAFPTRLTERFRRRIERRLGKHFGREAPDPALGANLSPRVRAWTRRKAALADGTRPWRPTAKSSEVQRALRAFRFRAQELLTKIALAPASGWRVLFAGLLRNVAAATYREIALWVKRHVRTIGRDVKRHLALLRTVPAYSELVARVARRALEIPASILGMKRA